MGIHFIYITTGSMDEAKGIGRALVSERLAACVNIIEPITAIYWWEGEIQEDKEVVLIAKTQEALVPDLVEKVTALHSDDCPCVVGLPVAGGHRPFLDWISAETGRGNRNC